MYVCEWCFLHLLNRMEIFVMKFCTIIYFILFHICDKEKATSACNKSKIALFSEKHTMTEPTNKQKANSNNITVFIILRHTGSANCFE